MSTQASSSSEECGLCFEVHGVFRNGDFVRLNKKKIIKIIINISTPTDMQYGFFTQIGNSMIHSDYFRSPYCDFALFPPPSVFVFFPTSHLFPIFFYIFTFTSVIPHFIPLHCFPTTAMIPLQTKQTKPSKSSMIKRSESNSSNDDSPNTGQ